MPNQHAVQTNLKEPNLFILLLLASFASISAVLYTPALPAITKSFGISNGQAQLTMTFFLIGYAFGNLPYGPFANRYGRKPAIYVGILLAVVGSLIIVLAGVWHAFWVLCFGRFLSALGSSVGLKICFTMIGDVYTQTKSIKIISYVMLSMAIAPGLAVALGGALTSYFGWESCFYFLAGYSVFLFFPSLFLSETAQEKEINALNLITIATGFARKLKNKKLVVCSLIMGCTSSFVYLFASEAPFIGINQLGLTTKEYGVLNFIPLIGMIMGILSAHQLAGKKEISSIIVLGILIAVLCALAMLSFFLLGFISRWTLFIPMPLIYIGLSLVLSNTSALAMVHAKNKSNGSAVMNFINMGMCVILLLIMQALPGHKAYTLPLFFSLLGLTMLVLWFVFLKKIPSSQKRRR